MLRGQSQEAMTFLFSSFLVNMNIMIVLLFYISLPISICFTFINPKHLEKTLSPHYTPLISARPITTLHSTNEAGTEKKDEQEWQTVVAAFDLYKSAFGDLKVRLYKEKHRRDTHHTHQLHPLPLGYYTPITLISNTSPIHHYITNAISSLASLFLI